MFSRNDSNPDTTGIILDESNHQEELTNCEADKN